MQPLPLTQDGVLRMLVHAREMAGHSFTASDMLSCISDLSNTTLDERLYLPHCLAAALSEQLAEMLRLLQADERDRLTGIRLAHRLAGLRQPMKSLMKQELSPAALSSLLTELRLLHQSELLSDIDDWLADHQTSAEEIAHKHTRRNTKFMEHLRHLTESFDLLRRLNWTRTLESVDPLHTRLLNDPAGLYEGMSQESRLLYRKQCAALGQRFRAGEEQIAETALRLCQEAEPGMLEHHVGYYLTESDGMALLHQSLGLRRGRLWLLVQRRRSSLRHAALWITTLALVIVYLHTRQPMLLLPFAGLLLGCVSRAVWQEKKTSALPAMSIPAVTQDLRTLVVLPAVLHDQHEAIRMVRKLVTLREAFPAIGVDCMLLGDYAPNITMRAGEDAVIIRAVTAAIDALDPEEGRFVYMQRSRIWDEKRRTYAPRDGRMGALTCICRLIAQGECEDVLDACSMAPALLHQRYAFVMALTPEVMPLPGMFDALLGCMSHPLNTRYPLPDGYRGYSIAIPDIRSDPRREGSAIRLLDMDAPRGFHSAGLIRPDAFLEAIDGQYAPGSLLDAAQLTGLLSGCIQTEADCIRDPAATVADRLKQLHRQTRTAWQLLPWLFPWVQTPEGMVHNPLDAASRHLVYEGLREALLPLCQLVLLAAASLLRSWPLALLSCFAPFLRTICSKRGWLRMLAGLALLPVRTVVSIRAVLRTIRQMLLRHSAQEEDLSADEQLQAMEVWSQGLAAALLLAVSIGYAPMFLPGIVLGGLFACFPLVHRYLDAPLPMPEVPSAGDVPLLEEAAAATWRYFTKCVTARTSYLPPCCVQVEPRRDTAPVTSPAAIGMYLLSCIAAKELRIIGPAEAARRMERTAATLSQLAFPLGLPCRTYDTQTLTPIDRSVDSLGCTLLLTGLMTCAQALRSDLPQLPASLHDLPGKLDAQSKRIELARLYDTSAQLFHPSLDAEGQSDDLIPYRADELILLSLTAAACSDVPPEHLRQLSSTRILTRHGALPLSRHGTATAYLLPGLFIPLDSRTARQVTACMTAQGAHGLFGQSESGCWSFDMSMQYLTHTFGLPGLSVGESDASPVFAPYAAALCLPYAGRETIRCLTHMRELGMLGRYGYCDAIDLRGSGSPALIRRYDTAHQGILLCAIAHVLADAPIQRYFTAIPKVEAALPLLHMEEDGLVLPARTWHSMPEDMQPVLARIADGTFAPVDAHLIGSSEGWMLVSAQGSSAMQIGQLPLTRFSGDAARLEGPQFYLADEGRIFRLNDPTLPGKTLFTSGSMRRECLCGSLQCVLTACVDPSGPRMVHVVEVTNLSTLDRTVTLADLLLPDLNAAPGALDIQRPHRHELTLHCLGADTAMHHAIQVDGTALSITVCTDETAFLGRGRTLRHPASLEEDAADLLVSSLEPCLSFRVQLALGGRGQATIVLTTGLSESSAVSPASTVSLSDMQACALLESIPVAAADRMRLSQLVGPVMWDMQPHQGSDAPTAMPASSLARLGIPADAPLLALLLQAADAAILWDALNFTAWLHLMHLPLRLCIVCTEATLPLAETALEESILDASSVILLPELPQETLHTLTAAARLVLISGAGTLEAQLQALRTPIPVQSAGTPIPAALPKGKVLHPSGYGGFDPETGDYLIRLDAGQTTPAPWENLLISHHLRATVDESGIRTPFAPFIRLVHQGTQFSPFDVRLPRVVQMGAGFTEWRTFTDALDIALTASLLPGHPAMLLALRIRNVARTASTLTVHIGARLPGFLTPVEGLVIASTPEERSTYLAGLEGGWQARCVPSMMAAGLQDEPCLTAPSSARGQTALLTLPLTIAPGASEEATCLIGYATSGDQAALALCDLRDQGASAMLRQIKGAWAAAIQRISIATPEDTLDRLMNRILPYQAMALPEASLDAVPALALMDARKARACLLLSASTDCGAPLPVAAAWYTRVTGDMAVLDAALPRTDETLWARCVSSIAEGDHLALYACDTLLSLREDAALRQRRQQLASTAERTWQDGHYGEALTLLPQLWAALAIGSTDRTRQAIEMVWTRLYDQQHGLVSDRESTDGLTLPGSVGNGAQDTRHAAWLLMALMHLHQDERAWELLRALNPIHHTDDILRTEEFRQAPYFLPGGMLAAPLDPGRAVSGGSGAAGWLYAAVLENMLGFCKRGNQVTLSPNVPADWDGYTIDWQEGSSTWHISLERGLTTLTLDGEERAGMTFTLTDDGRVHQVRAPLK
ncbi:MAG: DUF3131 domain-containing protein [Clostridia bacterium]|nr:DUF3131 domain-containing protein [Clostridia bacterium]